ncbi:MAG: UV damage endonuclease UvsE [Chloroflexaceae bacterium]|nr:UV damage endonuclease UvsE [Chloroflexaceae bacterium]
MKGDTQTVDNLLLRIRLGFPVRIVGKPTLRSHDARRNPPPHLSVNLIYLRDILVYLERIRVSFYRISSELLPEPANPETMAELADCVRELDFIAELVEVQGVRLTMHLDPFVALGSPDNEVAQRSQRIIEAQAWLLDSLHKGPDAVMVVHVGAAADDQATLSRFAQRYEQLSPMARARLVVEHDTQGWHLGRLLQLHQCCGIPIVFDLLHWQLANPDRLPLNMALGLALATWPDGSRPKIHLSTARSEAHLLPSNNNHPARILPPRYGQHADFVAVSDMHRLLEAARGLPPFDIMLEAKAGDLALQRLRHEIDPEGQILG